MQSHLVTNLQTHRVQLPRCSRFLRCGFNRGFRTRQLILLGCQGAYRFRCHLLQAGPRRSLDHGRQCAFDDRCRRQADIVSLLLRQKLQRHFGTEHGAAQVHEHEDTVFTVDGVDCLVYLHGVGADLMFRIVNSTSHGDRYVFLDHLPRQLRDACRESSTVRNDDYAYHNVIRGQQGSHYAGAYPPVRRA